MTESTLSIRPTPSGFAIDDGTQLLDACPCCDKPFATEAAALETRKAIESGKFTFEGAVAMVRLYRAAGIRPNDSI